MYTTIAAAAVWQFRLLLGPLFVGAPVRPNMPKSASDSVGKWTRNERAACAGAACRRRGYYRRTSVINNGKRKSSFDAGYALRASAEQQLKPCSRNHHRHHLL